MTNANIRGTPEGQGGLRLNEGLEGDSGLN